MIRPLDRERLRREFNSAEPFRFFAVDNFLDDGVVESLSGSYPTFEDAVKLGFTFNAVNEQKKVQISDSMKFPDPVKQLNEALASPQFLSDLSYIAGIENLVADPQLAGGGMHLTGPGGRLDVHVDFNFIRDRQLHRRLNILVYLNPVWEDSWGGHVELWDRDVKRCAHRFRPSGSRCVVFETSDISYHGVAPITDKKAVRRSFAAYYYTHEAPPHWKGVEHSTIFRSRPNEKARGYLLMPLERVQREARHQLVSTARKLKRWVLGPRP